MLRINHVNKRFSHKTVLRDVTFSLAGRSRAKSHFAGCHQQDLGGRICAGRMLPKLWKAV